MTSTEFNEQVEKVSSRFGRSLARGMYQIRRLVEGSGREAFMERVGHELADGAEHQRILAEQLAAGAPLSVALAAVVQQALERAAAPVQGPSAPPHQA